MSSAPHLPGTVRELFHVPQGNGYFLAHSVGAQPKATAGAIADHYLGPWQQKGGGAWADWLPAIEAFRASMARLIGAEASEICPQPGVSAAMERYLGSLPLPHESGRSVILMSAESFASIGYVATGLQALGYQLRFLPDAAAPDAIESWTNALTDEVAAVIPMHVYSNSGRVAPVADIAAAAHAVRAKCIVDVAQSVGILPVTPRAWGVDAVIGSCVKWLGGGPGAGWLWVPSEVIESLLPRSIGWWSHESPFEMNIRDFRYAPDALRFWGGTPDVAPFVSARIGIETHLAIGSGPSRAHNQALQSAFVERLQPHRPHWRWPTWAKGGTLCIGLGADKEAVAARITEGGFQADFRGDIMRVSFGAWNTADEMEALADSLSA